MMEIRKCQETDIAPIAAFYDRVIEWLNAHVNYPRWIRGVHPSESMVQDYIGNGSQYICVDHGRIAGTFALNDQPQGCYQNGKWTRNLEDGEYMVLHALAIDPEMHRQGVGTEIIRFCIDKAKADGYRAIRVDIVPGNFPSKRLFEKNGFTFAGDCDLELGIEDIPLFSMYELNW